MLEFVQDYNLPDNLPDELLLLILEYSGHVRRGHRSVSYYLYF